MSSFLRRARRACALLVFLCAVSTTPTASAAPLGPVTYSPPVDARVVDPFRAPVHTYGPGNRGLTYDTTPGQPAWAAGAGTVAFAGPVAGRLVVSVVHPDGLRTTYTRLRSIQVRRGDAVARGQTIGTVDARFHFGVKRGSRYLDPASLFRRVVRVRLVPRRGVPATPLALRSSAAVSCRASRVPTLLRRPGAPCVGHNTNSTIEVTPRSQFAAPAPMQ